MEGTNKTTTQNIEVENNEIFEEDSQLEVSTIQSETAFENDENDFVIKNKPIKSKKSKKNVKKEEDEETEVELPDLPRVYPKFRGADKIYHQILWDDRLDKSQFVIGYLDRFEGIIEIPLTTFIDEIRVDCPYHRIRFYKRNGEVVWDRKKKLNLL